jgi:hypothetical protein
MLKRASLGLAKGAVVGGLLGLACVYGLGMPVFAAWLAYLAAVLTGALTGLVAGRPIWIREARIEAGLKAAAGAILAAGAMFAVRRWLALSLDLGALGKGAVGDLPLASLPLIAAGLAFFFEIDNTGEPEPAVKKKTRVAGDGAAASDLADEESEESALDEDAEASRKARRH